jgi:pyridoxine 5-phosphate synthase
VHLREDRRHIIDEDVIAIRSAITLPLNLEMAVTEEMIAFALQHRPDEVCLVPENRMEVTTEGGLDVANNESKIRECVQALKSAGILVSPFVDADAKQIEAVARVGAPCLELHTGTYANTTGDEQLNVLKQLQASAEQAHSLGLQVNAGHGLNLQNLPAFLDTPHLHTLNIGHSIISRAVFVGLEQAVKDFLAALRA